MPTRTYPVHSYPYYVTVPDIFLFLPCSSGMVGMPLQLYTIVYDRLLTGYLWNQLLISSQRQSTQRLLSVKQTPLLIKQTKKHERAQVRDRFNVSMVDKTGYSSSIGKHWPFQALAISDVIQYNYLRFSLWEYSALSRPVT